MLPNAAKTLLAIVSCALVAQAQSSTTTTTAPASQSSLPALDACMTTCLTQAVANSTCASFSDIPCVCTSTGFQAAAGACLVANCTADDVTAATELQAAECASLSSSSAPASTATSSSASNATSSATSTSAAMALSAPFSFGSLVGTLVASAGVLVGAAVIL